MPHEYKDPDLEAALHNILDTFTGADGGARFVFFQTGIRAWDKDWNEKEDMASWKLLQIVKQFSRLIDVCYAASTKKT